MSPLSLTLVFFITSGVMMMVQADYYPLPLDSKFISSSPSEEDVSGVASVEDSTDNDIRDKRHLLWKLPHYGYGLPYYGYGIPHYGYRAPFYGYGYHGYRYPYRYGTYGYHG